MSIEILNIDHEHSFKFLYEIASVEDFAPRLLSPIITKILSTASSVRNKLSRLFDRYDYIQHLDVNIRKLSKTLDRYNYMDLGEVHIYKPISLNCYYIDLIQLIEDFQGELLNIDNRVLNPFLKWSGEVLNRPEKLQRLNVNRHFNFLDTKPIIKELDNLFDVNDTRDTVKFNTLFQSNVQVIEVVQRLNYIINRQNNLPAKKLLAQIDAVAKRAEMFVRRCNVDNLSELCSSSSKKVIADVLYDIGTEITLYSRLCYLIMSSTSAITDSVEKLFAME